MSAIELVCFPYAGGGAMSFNLLRRDLLAAGAGVNVTAVELPGRGIRRDEARFVDAVTCAGGLPVGLLSQPQWLASLMPAIRDDLRISQSYRRSAPLPCPLHLLGAYNDPLVTVDALAAWADYSAEPKPVRLFDGDHFLFQRSNPDVVAAVADIAGDALRRKEPAC